MTIRVVREPPPELWEAKCQCGAVLHAEKSDIRHPFEGPGQWVTCPRCGEWAAANTRVLYKSR